jgi:DNA-binding FrmR family transcriptional regulator
MPEKLKGDEVTARTRWTGSLYDSSYYFNPYMEKYRIEGQVRGIRRMVENNAYCPDILIQVAAANAALNSFNKVLLANHIKTCVTDDIRAGKEETVDELVKVLQKLMK